MIKYKDKITGHVYRLLAHATRLYGYKFKNVIVYYSDDNQHSVLVMNYAEFNDKYEEVVDNNFVFTQDNPDIK